LTTLHATAAYIYLLAPVPQGDNKEEDVPVKPLKIAASRHQTAPKTINRDAKIPVD
jgi:hypothetical protein